MTAAEQYRKALATERARRESAFLRLNERVGPFELRPFTALDYSTMHLLGSPFVCGGEIKPADVWQLLWHQSIKFQPTANVRRKLHQWAVIWYPDYRQLYKGCIEYVREAMIEVPQGKAGGKSFYSWLASAVDLLASEYGWTRDEILNLPMVELGQYLKSIRKRHDPKALLFNESDSLWRKAAMETAR